jgi:membrane protein implicated in regulation of membrane protease activity
MTRLIAGLCFWVGIGACVAFWYFFGLPFEFAFLIVGALALLIVSWLLFRERENVEHRPANNDAKLASPNDIKTTGLSRDL